MDDNKLYLTPISYADACQFVKDHHRHHEPPWGHKFSVACAYNDKVVGVVMVGRPVNRHMDNGFTLEVTRLATDGTKNVCSKLYSAAWRAAKAMGYKKMITYILQTESGISLRASGWKLIAEVRGRPWSHAKRKRADKHPLQNKLRFEITE